MAPRVRLPEGQGPTPLVAIGRRVLLAGAIVLVNWLIVVIERDSYRDSLDGDVSVVDALYYTTVTLSTTGYGDITPVTQTARLLNALLVTPLRVLFVIVLVGTTLQALTERSRTEIRLARWRKRMRGHIVVLGYGTKGRNALRALELRDHPRDHLVVVEAEPTAGAQATADGFTVVTGSATREEVLRDARVDRASTVIVALDRDDTAILATLTVRRLAPEVTIVAAAREQQHALLLQQSGASSVVVSSETAGRLLGLATDSPEAVHVVEDLLAFGAGLDIVDRQVRASEVGRRPAELPDPVVGVVRDARRLHYDDPGLGALRAGDRVLIVVAAT